MIKSISSFFFIFCFFTGVLGQTFTVGGTDAGISITGTNPKLITANGTASISTATIQGFLNAGTSVILFSSSGEISVTSNIVTTGAGSLTLKAIGNIRISAGIGIQTNSGNIILWADSDASGAGGIRIDDNVTLDTRTTADRTANTHTTGGGKIILAGGQDDAGVASSTATLSSGMTSTDGIPDGYAVNSGSAATQTGIVLGTSTVSNGHVSNVKMYSGSGEIRLHGMVNTTSSVDGPTGILAFEGYAINSGTNGNITLLGRANFSSFNGFVVGIDLAAWRPTNNDYSCTSSIVSVNGNINLIGRGTGATTANYGLIIDGSNNRHTIYTTGSGAITFDGLASGTSARDIRLTNVDVLSASGDINLNLNGVSSLDIGVWAIGNGLFLGQKAGSPVLSSSSKVKIVADGISATSAQPLTINTTGQFILQPLSNSFAAAISWPIANVSLTGISGLTIGKSTNTKDVTFATAQSIAGPITVYGGVINVNENLIASLANQAITLRATSNIFIPVSKLVQSNGGNIILWADSDASGSGGIRIDDNVTLDSRTAADRLASTHTTGGGKIILAGGLDDGGVASGTATLPTTLSSGDGIPDGFATNSGSGVTQTGIALGTSTANTGGHNCSVSFFSGGGEIRLHGLATNNSTNTSNGPTGLLFFEGYTFNGGNTGDITLIGKSQLTSGSWAIGMDLAAWRSVTSAYSTTSTIRTVNGAIKIIGRADNGSSGNLAMAIDGSNNRHVFTATGSGSITLDGHATGLTPTDLRLTNLDLLAASGAISVVARGSSGLSVGGYAIGNGLFLGKKDASLVTSSTSNITITSNALTATASQPLTVNSTGQLTVEPFSNSFNAALTWPMTNSTVTGITGLTLGKATNAMDINLSTAQTISGPITFYGANINVNQNLVSNSANQQIHLNASSAITLAANSTIQTSGGRILLWADRDANGGNIVLNSASNLLSNGGNIILAGGLDNGSGYGTSGDGIPDGYARGTGASGISTTGSFTISSGAGNILLRGQSDNQDGVLLSATTTGNLTTTTGNIDVYGVVTNAALIVNNPQSGIRTASSGTITIDSGSGLLTLDGYAPRYGLAFGVLASSAADITNTVIKSANTTNSAISLIGQSDQSTSGHGITFRGSSSNGTKILATAANGGITVNAICGNYSSTFYNPLDLLAVSGPINFYNSASTKGIYSASIALTIGSKSGVTGLTSSSSNVNFYLSKFESTLPNFSIGTTGQVKIQGVGGTAVFGQNFSSSTFGLNANSQTMSGFTFGSPNNTTNLTIAANLSVNGPITLHGGTLALNGNLTTTSSNSTPSNISLNGSTITGTPTLTLATGSTLTMNLSANTNFGGSLSGTSMSFVKNGAGVLSLSVPTALTFIDFTISGGTYRLNSNQQLTLSGALTNNGTFTMRSGATFVPSATVSNISGTGTYNVQRLLTGNESTWNTTNSGRFWYMGVPVNSTPRSSFGTQGSTTNRVWSYSESSKQYTEITSGTDLLSGGTGYVHRRTTNDTLTFSGVGANGLRGSAFTQSNMTRTSGASVGFHLVSNPYMAYVDWDAVTKTNIESTYYIRSAATGNISALISYNAVGQNYVNGGVSNITSAADVRYLAPMQAFWVRVGPNTGTGSLGMNTGMLSHQTNNPGLKSSTVFPTLARVNLVDGARFDQMLVFMNQDMSNAVDQYDSEKMFVSGAPQIYTMAAGKKLVMNGLRDDKKKVSVPLYLELPTTKSYELHLCEYQIEEGVILLEDKQEGVMIDFSLQNHYVFEASSGVLQNRFVLHFILPQTGQVTEGPSNSWAAAESPSYTDGADILIASDSRGKIQISVNQAETQKVAGTVAVTDANGKVVYNGQLEGLFTEFELNVPSGIYYLTVRSGNQIKQQKVFVQG